MTAEGDAVRAIVAATGCSAHEAAGAYRTAHGDVERAVSMLRGTAACAVRIAKYTNGLLIEGKFYDYALRENRELLRMLERGEFDREVLCVGTEEAYVVTEEHGVAYAYDLHTVRDGLAVEDREVPGAQHSVHRLHIPSRTKDLQLGLPEIVDLTRPGCGVVRFRLCFGEEVSTFLAPASVLVKDILDYLFAHTGLALRLERQGRVLDGEASVLVIEQCMVDVVL